MLTKMLTASDRRFYGFEGDVPVAALVFLTMAEILKSPGQARELAVLANSQFHIEQVSYDNWNGGTTGWGIIFSLYASLFSRLTKDERTRICC